MTDRLSQDGARHPLVLIVEDEAISRRALTALLNASGFDTYAVASGEEALDAVGSVSAEGMLPEIALVDLDLPGMSGIEFIQRLAAVVPGIRPVLITATSRERLDELLESQFVSYMRKPIDFKCLLHVIESQEVAH